MGAQATRCCCHVDGLAKPKRTVAGAPVAAAPRDPQREDDYLKRYEELQLVSQQNADVFMVRQNPTGFLYICRRVHMDKAPMRDSPEVLRRHLLAVCELEHPHLCKWVEAFWSDHDLLLITEAASPPTLFAFIDERGLTNGELDAAEIVRQILSALQHSHRRNIVHGRLEPINLLFAGAGGGVTKDGRGPPQLKICDMGLGFVLMPAHTAATAESLQALSCVPPEQCANASDFVDGSNWPALGDAPSAREDYEENPAPVVGLVPCGAAPPYADRIDIWAVGVIAYRLLTGTMPFEAQTHEVLVHSIQHEPVSYREAEWAAHSQKALDAVRAMLKIIPRLRPTARQMLRHPWLKLPSAGVQKRKVLRLFRSAALNLQEGQLKKVVIRVIAEQMPRTHPHVELVQKAFVAMDKDRDGLVSRDEFLSFVRKIPDLESFLGGDPGALFDAADRDHSGALNVNELIALTLPTKESLNDKNLWFAFRAFDRNESGTITGAEIENTVRILDGCLLAPEQLEELLDALRLELTNLGFDREYESLAAGESHGLLTNIKSVIPCGPRRLDFGEFIYICSLQPNDWRLYKWSRKEVYKVVEMFSGIDMYNLAHKTQPLTWPPGEGAQARTPRSVHRISGGLIADRGRKAQARARSKRYSSVTAKAKARQSCRASQMRTSVTAPKFSWQKTSSDSSSGATSESSSP